MRVLRRVPTLTVGMMLCSDCKLPIRFGEGSELHEVEIRGRIFYRVRHRGGCAAGQQRLAV